jgi:hypothetical protein
LAGVIVNRVPAPAPAASRSLGAGGQAAMDFLAARQARAQAAIGMLRSGLDAFADAGMRIDGWMLPDLGAVPEPLPAGFGSHWLRSGGPL